MFISTVNEANLTILRQGTMMPRLCRRSINRRLREQIKVKGEQPKKAPDTIMMLEVASDWVNSVSKGPINSEENIGNLSSPQALQAHQKMSLNQRA